MTQLSRSASYLALYIVASRRKENLSLLQQQLKELLEHKGRGFIELSMGHDEIRKGRVVLKCLSQPRHFEP